MALTLAQKIIARAAGQKLVHPGEVVTVKVDLAMTHDSGGPRRMEPILKKLGAGLFDRTKVVLISDHFVPGDTDEGAHPRIHPRLGEAVQNCLL
jgi:3-isopropylmalate/(R)-2-methylmalate dehydratase large subunit